MQVKLEGLTFDVIEKRQDRGATEFGYGTPYDPDIELYSLLALEVRDRRPTPYTNYPRTRNAAIDRALDDARATLDAGDAQGRPTRGCRPSTRRTRAGCGSCACATSSRSASASAASTPQVEPHAHGFSRGTTWNLEDWTLGPAR